MTALVMLCACAGPLAGIAADPKAGQDKGPSALGKEIRIPTNTGFSTNVSPDGRAATVIFDNLYVESRPTAQGAMGATGQTDIQTKAVTIQVPYSTDQRSLAMTLDLRGYLSTTPGASVRLVACAGDATTAVDLTKAAGGQVTLKGKSKEAIAAGQQAGQVGDFQTRVRFTVQTHAAKPVCQVTLFLAAEHDTDKANSGGALVAVDSLDLTIAKPGEGKYKP